MIGSEADRPNKQLVVALRSRVTLVKILFCPDPYLGDAFVDGDLTIERGSLRSLLQFCFVNFDAVDHPGRARLPYRWLGLPRLKTASTTNTRRLARHNASAHYDLPDTLYDLFLDDDRRDSCAYFTAADDMLEQAQTAKKDRIATKLLLAPGVSVLDIDCGWGGRACTLAKRGASRVVGITLSEAQLRVARDRAQAAGLEDRVRFELTDYREEMGAYDRIVSVGMFEHVGRRSYGLFFSHIRDAALARGRRRRPFIARRTSPAPTSP